MIKLTLPEHLDVNQQISLGSAAQALMSDKTYKYCMEVMRERLHQRWLEASSTEDREMCWALAVAHENLDRTLREFSQRAGVAEEIASDPNVSVFGKNEDAPA